MKENSMKKEYIEKIKTLRDSGYKVDITHYRRFAQLAPSNDAIVINYVGYSRKNKDLKHLASKSFGGLLNKGGTTFVEVYRPLVDDQTPELEEYYCGQSDCSIQDQFEYSTGINLALDRAMKEMQSTKQED